MLIEKSRTSVHAPNGQSHRQSPEPEVANRFMAALTNQHADASKVSEETSDSLSRFSAAAKESMLWSSDSTGQSVQDTLMPTSIRPNFQPQTDESTALQQTVATPSRSASQQSANAATPAGDQKQHSFTPSITSEFQNQFASKAGNKEAFHSFMRTVYGETYNTGTAENLRQKALKGDFSWLPKVEYTSSDALRGANGAYDKEAGVVYINKNLKGSDLAAQTFVEEAGHHIDTLVNKSDAAGDEGELFRRVLAGEHLNVAQMSEIRAETDKGTITVDGRQIQVEFWNPLKAIGKGFKAIGNAVNDGLKAVGNATKTVAKGLFNIAGGTIKNLGKGIGNFGKNLFKGKFADAFGSLGEGVLDAGRSILKGTDQIFLQTPQTFYNGAINGARRIFNGMTEFIPGGKYLREVTDRIFDSGRSLLQTAFGIARDSFRAPFELALDFTENIGNSFGHLFRGEFEQAAEQFGRSFLNFGKGAIGRGLDMSLRGLHAAADIVGMAIGQPPSRPLSSDEEAYLRSIYGNSLDYSQIRIRQGGITDAFGMAAHVIGNTAYMPAGEFKADGTLTQDGLETLGHEVGHIWQNQNGGGDYIHEALYAQMVATIESGNRNDAYDWREAMRAGIAFEDMNPEQQASMAEEIGIALRNDNKVTHADFGDLTAEEFNFLLKSWGMIRAGEGAP